MNGNYKKIISDNIARFTKEKFRRQTNLADAIECDRQQVSRWCTGAITPSVDRLIELAELYDVPLASLFATETEHNYLDVGKKVSERPILKQLMDIFIAMPDDDIFIIIEILNKLDSISNKISDDNFDALECVGCKPDALELATLATTISKKDLYLLLKLARIAQKEPLVD